MNRKASWTTALALTVTLALSACGGSGEPGAERAPDPTGDWVLTEGSGPDGPLVLVEAAPVTLSIAAERWGGVAACNSYGGSVSLDGDRLTFDDGLAVTEMACLDEAVMALEGAYLGAFQAAERVELRGARLVLTGPDTELVYDEVPAEPDADLVGTVWQLEALIDGLGPDGSVSSVVGEPTLELTPDGEVQGDTGCNTFSGSYELDGATLTLGPLTTTRMACGGPKGAQEEQVLSVLEAGSLEIAIDGAILRLTADARALDYRAD
jgi:heat shock protein HslJ